MKILSTKVPRTGSQTFEWLLKDMFPQPKVSMPEYFLEPELYDPNSLWYTDKGEFLRQWREHPGYNNLPPDVQYIHAHHPIEMYDGLYPEALRIVWLRDPLSFVISCYYFSKQIGHIPENMPIEEYVELDYRRNWMTMYTNGDLSQYHFVGLVVNYKRDVNRFRELVGWPSMDPKSIPKINEGSHPDYNHAKFAHYMDEDLINRILTIHSDDRELYLEARSLEARE